MLPCCAASITYRVETGYKMGFPLEKGSSIEEVARQVQAAEFFQLFFFGSQALLYFLALRGVIPTKAAGIATLGLLPIQATAYHRSMVLYGDKSRFYLTIIASLSLALIAIFSIRKMPGDYAFTMCGGGFVVNAIRLLSERSDHKHKKNNVENYQSKEEKVPSFFAWCLDSFKDRVEKARHAKLLTCSDTEAATLARKIQIAELFQILYFASMTVLFGLTLAGRITPLTAGICALSLLPFQTYANYVTMVLYGKRGRQMLSTVVFISLALMGISSVMGKPGDFTWMLCLGNLLFHTFRVTMERRDYKKTLEGVSKGDTPHSPPLLN